MNWKTALKAAIAWPQSGVVPCRIRNGELEILLITTLSGKRWIIPKGNVELLMSPAASAAKEAREEAGVLGTVKLPAIGTYQYRKRGMVNQVQVFLMQVETELEDWEEAKLRRRRWLTLQQAIECVEPASLRLILAAIDPQAIELRAGFDSL